MYSNFGLRLAIILTAIAALLVAHLYGTIGANLLGRVLQNALHVPAFAGLAVLLAWCLPSWSRLQLLGGCLAAGVLLEGVQVFFQREASLYDLGLDALGVVIALVAFVPGSDNTQPVARKVFAGVSVLVFLTGVLPGWIYLSYLHRDALFPALLDVGSWRQKPLLTSNSPMSVVVREWADGVERGAVRTCWSDARYPGLTFSEVVADWRAYKKLVVELAVPGNRALSLTAAVGHVGTPGTSAYIPAMFAPGFHEWSVPIADLLRTTNSKPALVSRLILHSSSEYAGECVLIAAVRLE